jgi:hypothetical protein
MGLSDRELEDRIEKLVRLMSPRMKRREELTEADLSEAIFGDVSSQRRVNQACRRLVDDGRLDREGRGVAHDPHRYRPVLSPPKYRLKDPLDAARGDIK